MRVPRVSPVLLSLLLVACQSDPPPPDPPEAPPARDSADLGDDPLAADPVLLTGSPGGAYYKIARHLAGVVSAEGGALQVLSTRGAIESLYLLAWGHGDFAIVQGDVLESPRHRAARAEVEIVGPLINEELHAIVRRGSPIKTLLDLRGRKVATGALGSGTAMTVADVLRVGQIGDVELEHLGLKAGLAALRAEQVDALLYVGAVPLPALEEEQGLAWVSISERTLNAFPWEQSPYLSAELQAPYAWEPGEVGTLAVPAYLVRRKDVDPRALIEAVNLAADPESRHALSLLDGVVVDEDPPPPPEFEVIPAAPQREVLRLLSGPEGGSYAACGADLGELSSRVEAFQTQGSLRNLILIAAGEGDLAIVQGDVIEQGLIAEATRAQVESLRLVLPLYLETLHVVVPKDSEVTKLRQLAGRRVAVGETGSGTQVTARRLLRTLEWPRGTLQARAVGGGLAWESLLRGELDAAFFVSRQPIARFDDRARFLAVADGSTRIDPRHYGWLEEGVPAQGVQAFLVARSDADPSTIKELIVSFFAERETLLANNPRWEDVTIDSIEHYAGPLPRHPGLESALEGELR